MSLKENVRPIEDEKKSETVVLQDIINHFEKAYKKYRGNDPLTIFSDLIRHCEKFLSKSKDENDRVLFRDAYIKSLRRCLLVESYKNDERFIKFFFGYALVYEKSPHHLFKRMYQNDFGKKSADFIIEWAKLFSDSNKEEEIAIIKQGLVNDAEPKEKLDDYYRALKKKEFSETKIKLMFHTQPLENYYFDHFDPEKNSYQFEEIRARTYTHVIKMVNENNKNLSKNDQASHDAKEKAYLKEIEELKKRLKQAEENISQKDEAYQVLLIRNAQREKRDSADRTNHSVWFNKTRDSISKNATTYSPDQTTGNYDNFTNVTVGNFETTENFESSNWLTHCKNETITGNTKIGEEMDLSDSESEERVIDEVKLKNFSNKLAKLSQDESVASRTMPPPPQAPLALSLTLDNTKTQKLLEPESICKKYNHINYFNESDVNNESNIAPNSYQSNFKKPMTKFNADFNNTTCFQETDLPTARIYDARDKLSNCVRMLDTPNNKSQPDDKPCSKDILVSNTFNNTKDDFSIFIDNSAVAANNSDKELTNDSHIPAPAKQNLLTEEASQVFFDPTTVKDLHSRAAIEKSNQPKAKNLIQQSRKPLGVLSDDVSFANPGMPNFELTDTTLSTTSKIGSFEPCSASTRFFKTNPIQNNCFRLENDLEKEIEEDEAEAEAEKEKLLSEYLKSNENSKKSSLSNNNTVENIISSKQDAESEGRTTKKIRYTETTSLVKSCKTLYWDDEMAINGSQEYQNTNEGYESKDEFSKILSPSNKLFSDKTEKLNLIQNNSTILKEKFNNEYPNDTMGKERSYDKNFPKVFYNLGTNFDITANQSESSMTNIFKKPEENFGHTKSFLVNLEQPAELTSKLSELQKTDISELEDEEITMIEENNKVENEENNSSKIHFIQKNKSELIHEHPDFGNESMTSEAMEQSFNHVYKKYFVQNYPDNGIETNDSESIVMNASRILNRSENMEKAFKNKSFNLEQQPKELTSKLGALPVIEETELADDSRMINDETNNLTTTMNEDDSSNSNDESSSTTTNKNLNETIIQSIRNPFSYEIKNRLLKRCGGLEYLKTKSTFTNLLVNAPIIKEKCNVFLAGSGSYNVNKEIGKGSYAVIYAISNKTETYALKVDKQATAWEYYVTDTLHDRLLELLQNKKMKINVIDSFVRMKLFMKYNDGCLSLMNYYKNGSLLDLINYHININEQFPYWFVLYLTLEMLNILNYLHKCKILHADIKPDNFLVDALPNGFDYFTPERTRCLVLIDFNRSIDQNTLPDTEQEFLAKVDNKSLLCTEMKSGKSWSKQIDFYGILYSIHSIIFKKYMNLYTENDRFKLTNSFPRNYDPLFKRLFDTYLNLASSRTMPNLEDEYINEFVPIFKNELATSFNKSKQYLADLNKNFKPSVETKAKMK